MSELNFYKIVALAKASGIENHPEVEEWLEAALQFPHEKFVVEGAAQIVGHYATQPNNYAINPFAFRPEYLVASTSPEDGFLQGNCDNNPIYIERELRKRCEVVVGKPGTGKSTYIAQQIKQAIDKGLMVWLFDFKDEHGPLADSLGIASLKLEEMKLNPHELLNVADAVECFAHANLFQNASTGFYRDALFKTVEIYDDEIPSVQHVRKTAELMSPRKSTPEGFRIDPYRRQTLLSRDRVLRALDDLLDPYGDIVDCEHGFPIKELANQSFRFNCRGVGYKEATYLIYVLLKALYNYRNEKRIQESRFDNPLKNLVVIEEAKHVVSRLMEEGLKTAPAFIRKITTEVRSSGIGYIFSDQVPSDLAKSAIESSNIVTLFRVGLKEDVSVIGGAMGIPDEHLGKVYELQDRTAITKHGEKRPIRIEIELERKRE